MFQLQNLQTSGIGQTSMSRVMSHDFLIFLYLPTDPLQHNANATISERSTRARTARGGRGRALFLHWP